MENRLKERLTGAAILVALIVLLVPEIFRGQRDDEHPASTVAASDGAPVRSYTIDLSNKGSEPLQSTGDNATDNAAKAPSAAVPAPSPAIASPAPAVTPVEPRAAAPASRAPPAAPHPAPEVHVPSARPVAATHPSRSAGSSSPPPTPPPTPPPVARPAAAGGWSVQLGLFAKRENAERLSGDAHNKGFQTGISSDAKGQYRVRTSGVADRAAAESLVQRLKSAGFPAAIVAPK